SVPAQALPLLDVAYLDGFSLTTNTRRGLPSFGQLYNRYSFVINSFIAAKNFGRDHDRLADLAAFCGHISAQIPALADEWVAAIKALCCSSGSQYTGYGELLAHIDVRFFLKF
ncbi:hypothetical protein COOONC_17875, partial [Cooperia oncophora]